jgi:hypothetical protein
MVKMLAHGVGRTLRHEGIYGSCETLHDTLPSPNSFGFLFVIYILASVFPENSQAAVTQSRHILQRHFLLLSEHHIQGF